MGRMIEVDKQLLGTVKATGMYAIKSNGCLAIRDSFNTIKIQTNNALNDTQMKELFFIAEGMSKTGLTLKDIFEKE